MQDPAVPSLQRPSPQKTVISLVPMIDVMLILLVFFMVTSTYLNLDMIPAVDQGDAPLDATASATEETAPPVLIRLGADGIPTVRGVPLPQDELRALLAERVRDDPFVRVLILPSAAADVQSLVALMDTATQMGAVNMSVIRLEGSQ